MRGIHAYPHDAVSGCCFVTGDYTPHNIVDLEIYLDALPPYGRLCVSEKAVRDMVTALGWRWPDEDLITDARRLAEEKDHLLDENRKLRKALTMVVNAAKLAAIDDWMVST